MKFNLGFINPGEQAEVQIPSPECGTEKLDINVIFTECQTTRAALKTAAELSRDLGAKVRLLAPHHVPFSFPLDKPPVSLAFNEQRLMALAHELKGDLSEIQIHLLLCRDRVQAILRMLTPRSVIVIGGRKRWWPTAESRLAANLRSKGHQVLLTF